LIGRQTLAIPIIDGDARQIRRSRKLIDHQSWREEFFASRNRASQKSWMYGSFSVIANARADRQRVTASDGDDVL
jgi:hypothetical protein